MTDPVIGATVSDMPQKQHWLTFSKVPITITEVIDLTKVQYCLAQSPNPITKAAVPDLATNVSLCSVYLPQHSPTFSPRPHTHFQEVTLSASAFATRKLCISSLVPKCL